MESIYYNILGRGSPRTLTRNNAATQIQSAFRTYKKLRQNNVAGVTQSQQAQLRILKKPHNPYGAIFVPKLNPIGSVNIDANGHKTAVDQIRAIISDIFSDIDQSITNQYITQLEKFKAEEQNSLRNMLLQIQQTLLETQNENIKTIVKSVITEAVCFTGQKNALIQILESNQIPCKTTSIFELKFNAMIISVINKLAQDILNDINKKVFFNAPDPQSSHQIEPVRKWLDVRLNLYGGSYPEDVYNQTTPFVNQMIYNSFTRVIGQDRLTLDFWVKTISDEINQNPEQCIMLCDYLNQIVTDNALSQHFLPSFINELGDELAKISKSADPPLYTQDDFKFILKKEGIFPPVFYPSEQLIRKLLSVNLNKMNRARLEVTPSGKQQTEGEDSFCLRNGIKRSVIEAAHATREAVIETIKNLPNHWSQEETVLFFHIISRKHDDITNGIQFSDEEKQRLVARLKEQNEHGETPVFIAAQKGHADAIRVLKELEADVNTPNNGSVALTRFNTITTVVAA